MKDKSRLAKLLAEEDIHVVHKQVETAAFDVKNRELVLPIWKDMNENVQDLFTLHEVGHAFWTPLDMLETAKRENIEFSFVNVLEDVRIEKMIQTKYPGGVRCFNKGYEELLGMDFFKIKGKNLKSLNLIDRINLHYKNVADVPFSDEEMVWVEKSNNTKTPKQVLTLAKELYQYIEENKESQGDPENGDKSDVNQSSMPSDGNESDEQTPQKSDGDDGKQDNQENGESDDQSGAGDDQKDDQEEQTPNGSSGADNESEDKKDDKKEVVSNGREGGKSDDKPFVASTDSAYQSASKKFIDSTATDRMYSWIPKLNNIKDLIETPSDLLLELREAYKGDHQNTFFQYTQNELKEFLASSKKTVSYITKEFEMKKAASQYNRATTSKTGTLDMSKLHTYKYNDDLFAKVTTLPGATNHGLVFFLDWSGSMQENMSGTMKQLFNLTEFCMRTKIPFDVYAFSDRCTRSKLESAFKQEFKSGDLTIEDLKLFNFLSSSMKKKEQFEMMHYMFMMGEAWKGYRQWTIEGYPISPPYKFLLGGTPLNHAIVAAMKIVPDFQKKHGVEKIHTVFLTDGYSHRLDDAFTIITDRDGNDIETTKPVQGWRRSITHITDPITNAKIVIGESNGYRNEQTVAMFKLLKKRVPNMNIVGFFIAGSGKRGMVHKNIISDKFDLHSYTDYNAIKDIYRKLKKENVVVCKEEGYDEFYILPGAGAMKESEEFEVSPNAKVSELKRAFMKSANNKMANRPVLNKFVGMIA